jgi:nucleoside 2-deoxyribosyltransferase
MTPLMNLNIMNCPLCKSRDYASYTSTDRNVTHYECKNCGKFALTAHASSEIETDGWKLAAYVIEQNRHGNIPTFYSSQQSLTMPRYSQQSLQADAPAGSVGIDAAIEMFPKSVVERLDRALINLASITTMLGQRLMISPQETFPLMLAQNTVEAWFVLQQFEEEGYLKGKTNSFPTEVSLTAKGLNRVADLQRGLFGPFNKQAFIAMSFHNSLDEAWTHGLKLGIEDCGYEALRVDLKEHNEKICDVIVAEIRKSKFLVADFTRHRNGVYFEAGMMMGLGRPVIFTCRKDYLGEAHFDTRQYNHIDWETPAELREKLKSRIQATIVS